jgi:hypothetical protein
MMAWTLREDTSTGERLLRFISKMAYVLFGEPSPSSPNTCLREAGLAVVKNKEI